MQYQFLKVGKIVNTFGIKGEVKVYLYTDFPMKRFKKGNTLFIGSEAHPNELEVTIERAKPYKNMYLLKLEQFDNINDVIKFKEHFLWISQEQQGELEQGEYYYHQIIGCEVKTKDGETLGTIKEILSPGANDVWVVKSRKNNKEILIPYIESVVKHVNIADKVVTIEVMEGLLD